MQTQVRKGSYRYGFQGQEMDDEVKGEGNSINYKYRMHDPRVGRFFAVDPLAKGLPFYSPYNFAFNKPILMIDKNGLHGWPTTSNWTYEDVLGYQTFVQTEIIRITAEAVKQNLKPGDKCNDNSIPDICFDCADFAVSMLIRYAAENGKEVSFTLVDGQVVTNETDGFYFKGIGYVKLDGVKDFEKDVRGFSDARSLLNDMVSVDDGDVRYGDLVNTGSHLQLVTNAIKQKGATLDGDYYLDEGYYVTQGTLPPEIPRGSYSFTIQVSRWDYLDMSPPRESLVSFEYEGTEVENVNRNDNYQW